MVAPLDSHLVQAISGQFHVGFDDHFAGGRVDNVGCGDRAVELGGFNFNLVDARGTNRLQTSAP